MMYERPRVAILTDYLLHPVHDLILPTAANLSLLRLLRYIREEMEWDATVYQISPIPERFCAGFKVAGIKTAPDRNGMFPELNFAFAREGLAHDLRIYYHWHLAFPQVARCSVVVSQGIFWDSPDSVLNRTNQVGREEWLKRLLYAVAASARFVAQDRNTINVIKATWPGYEHRLRYLPPGVDLEAFRPRERGRAGGPVKVLCHQDFGMEQGLNEILALCELTLGEQPEIEYHIIGRMREFRTAAALAAKVGALPNCRYYWAPSATYPKLYRGFDLALLPYRACAGASPYCLWAMASGLPVVAGLAGGLAELVVDDWNGRLVQPGSAVVLQEVLMPLVRDEGLRERLGRNARRLAEGYPEAAWLNRWRHLLEEVLRESGV